MPTIVSCPPRSGSHRAGGGSLPRRLGAAVLAGAATVVLSVAPAAPASADLQTIIPPSSATTPATMLVPSAPSTGDTTTTVTADPPTSVQGNLVAYLATVHPASGKPVPTGTVSFTAGSTQLCAVPIPLNGVGKAKCKSTKTPVGTTTVTASYSGDVNLASSFGATVETVSAPGYPGPRTPPSSTTSMFGSSTNEAAPGKGRHCSVGEVILSAGNLANGVIANGQLLPIRQYSELFSLLGTRYGGDGRINFALPDLRAAAPNGLTYSICKAGVMPKPY